MIFLDGGQLALLVLLQHQVGVAKVVAKGLIFKERYYEVNIIIFFINKLFLITDCSDKKKGKDCIDRQVSMLHAPCNLPTL